MDSCAAIDVWNENPYNGQMYFEEGEVVKGIPYTLFTSEVVSNSQLLLEQYKQIAASNSSATAYCVSTGSNRKGPVYGNCCASFVSEVFGGRFMNGLTPAQTNVNGIRNSIYSTNYTNVKADQLQPGDAVANTSGGHIFWIGEVTKDSITIYESTPPISRRITRKLSEVTDASGYLSLCYDEETKVYSTYNRVTRSNAMIRDDLVQDSPMDARMPMPFRVSGLAQGNTMLYKETENAYQVFAELSGGIYQLGWIDKSSAFELVDTDQTESETGETNQTESETESEHQDTRPQSSAGDVNGDGAVDGKDLVRLRRYLVSVDDSGTSDIEIATGADVNEDGSINGKDLIRLRQYLVEK